ncbi:MAG: HAMP domain-containing protein [Synergistaceae bacterium]|jgi:two-component system sensor histidine kinase CpxA|nr:HAMP domain-containing protein [Synergistaceae bacterium]
MMNMTNSFPLFWKIYLTLLLVLFLPMILFNLSRIVHEEYRNMPEGIIRHLEWSASQLANQSESVSSRDMGAWIENVKESTGLDICVTRDGANFYPPGLEWFAPSMARERLDTPPRPFQPIMALSASSSGRTEVTAILYPFRREAGGAPQLRNIAVLLLVAGLSVVFSFMLVHNFMTPLSELRRITLKLASGDLSVRVGRSVTGRSDEIADLGAGFNRMAECVENLISSQKRLLSDISHEIRSPLQRMEVALAILRRGSSADDEAYIDRMELEIYRIDNMVEELLTLTRSDGVTLTQTERLELDEMINSIIEDIEFETGEKKNIIADTQKLSVLGDAMLLNRALSNVIHNAIRHAPPNTGIEVNACRDGECVAISVKDHGQGVPNDELDKIFMPYYRTDKARERSKGGVGLGLAITKRIIENHGGRITAANDPSGGLTVTIILKRSPC